MCALRWHGARFEELDELLAAIWLDPLTSDFYYYWCEYSLTEYGRSVLPLVEDVRLWGRAQMARLISRQF